MYKKGQEHDINCTLTYKDYMKLLIKEIVKHTMPKKLFTNSKDECEYHQRLQFALNKSKTGPFGLFVSSYTVMNGSETSVSRRYVNEFIQNFSILCHRPSPQSSNVLLFKPLLLNLYLLELDS